VANLGLQPSSEPAGRLTRVIDDAMGTLSLNGQVALIAGAGGEIGRATAELFTERGAVVICADASAETAEETVSLVTSQGGSGTALAMDVTDLSDVRQAFDQIVSRWPQVHILVNTVGVQGPIEPFSHDVELDGFIRTCSVNLLGAFILSKVVLPHMVGCGYGRVAHLASLAGKDGIAGMSAYSASKAGLIGLVKSQGKEYAETGVLINALAPAMLHTSFNASHPPQLRQELVNKIPMKREGTTTEAAEMLAWMVSSACTFTTGFTFDLSGGRSTY
jgi:2-dehydro-3-deoxy-L-rhamnonate dehydrogenase (NAD+)